MFLVFLDLPYWLAGIRLIFLQSCFFLLRGTAGLRFACAFFKNAGTVLSFRKTKFYVHAIPNDLGYIFECFIEKSYEAVASFVPREGDVCFDIGANVGACALSWRRSNSTGKIICFEPHPDSYARLKKNIGLNKFQNIEALPLAISSHNGPMEMFTEEGSSMMTAGSGHQKSRHVVQGCTLDDFIHSRPEIRPAGGGIDLCKIDVEGHELAVLSGAEKTLPLIGRLVIECHSRELLQKVKQELERHLFVIREEGIKDNLIFAERKI